MCASKQMQLPTRSRRQPCAIYFAEDVVARAAVESCTRVQYAVFDSQGGDRSNVPCVFVVADEKIFAENLKLLRSAEVRVLVLREERFADPRLDGTVYAYLPPKAPAAMLERMFDNAIDHMHLVQTRREASDKLAAANTEIYELNHIGAALSAQLETPELLDLILTKCREITRADAGSLYLVEEPPEAADGSRAQKFLRFKMAQNDTVHVTFRETVLPISEDSIAGYVAQHGTVVMIEDAYEMESWVPYSINKQFDIDSGYRTKSILAVAMMNPKNEIVGVVQLINAKRNWRARLNAAETIDQEVVPFTTRQMEIVSSLASQAAVSYENSQLYESIQRLFEGFVKASIKAIEQRDPTTSGHSERVANLTVAMAEAVDRDNTTYKGVHFTKADMKAIRFASLLHDFGKVAVREEVLIKAHKLYPAQMATLVARFAYARRTFEAEAAQRKLAYLTTNGRENYAKAAAGFDEELRARCEELYRFLRLIETANEPTVLPEGSFETLQEIHQRTFLGPDGTLQPLLTGEELRMLSIRKGSLDQHEREEVESHVLHTYNFLRQIPWTREIRHVPEIARHHHERINGLGYPGQLSGDAIPLATRLMSIADIFDALAAADRPYKSSVSVEDALKILEDMAKRGDLDEVAFGLFKREKVYEQWRVSREQE
jgi:HD-GYP domain-containing protein (c-di-GMP phosphodiesterase class II)